MVQEKQLKKILLFLIIIFVCGFFYWGLKQIFSINIDENLSTTMTFEYDPKTIIQDIHQGKLNLFTETETTMSTNFIHQDAEITKFSDIEFYEIGNYILKNSSSKQSEKWNLVETRYRYFDCPSTHDDDAILTEFLFMSDNSVDDKNHLYNIGIATYSNTITMRFIEEQDDVIRQTLDINAIGLSSSEIIKIVKKSGTYMGKQEEVNYCGYFLVSMIGDEEFWEVNYYKGSDAELLFSLGVSSRTGSVISYSIEDE